jgi:hypothetical protein
MNCPICTTPLTAQFAALVSGQVVILLEDEAGHESLSVQPKERFMMRELTKDERRAMDQARTELFDGVDLGSIKPETANSASFRAGFIAGLDYQAARLAQLERHADAYRAYATGQITWGELEEVINAASPPAQA